MLDGERAMPGPWLPVNSTVMDTAAKRLMMAWLLQGCRFRHRERETERQRDRETERDRREKREEKERREKREEKEVRVCG